MTFDHSCALRPVTALLLAAPVLASPQDTVVSGAAKDNTLYSEGGLSNGIGNFVFTGRTGSGTLRRAVLHFDIAGSVPAGATITDVTLTLSMNQTIAGAEEVTLHRLLQDWGEGSSAAPGFEGAGGPAEPGDCTWNQTFWPGAGFWNTPGGDFTASPSASQIVDSFGFYSWSGAGLVADAQDMLDNPSSDFGWLLKQDELLDFTAKRFGSKDHFSPIEWPSLEITYSGGGSTNVYCQSLPNSTGSVAGIWTSGSLAPLDDDFTLVAGPTPDQFGLFFFSAGQANGGAGVAFGNGVRCVGGGGNQIFRLPVIIASSGQFSHLVDFGTVPGDLITSGSTWNFQLWFRDPPAGGANFNLSNGLEVAFQ